MTTTASEPTLPATDDATPDPLHGRSRPESTWSSTNASEAMPGVLTPLGWSMWGPASDMAVRRVFHALGVLAAAETGHPADETERIVNVFYGRPAVRGEFFCRMGDRLPGTSGAAIAEQIFAGALPDSWNSRPDRRWYPKAAVRFPIAFARAPRLARAARASTEPWWREELRTMGAAGLDEARARFLAANRRFDETVTTQALAVFAGVQPVYDQLTRMAEVAGEVGNGLMAGYGAHQELAVVTDLWACSRDRLDLATFLDRHGYHGPGEGEVSAVVWREDPAPVVQLLDGYRGQGDAADPVAAEAARSHQRVALERQFLASLPRHRRAGAHALLRLARRYIPLRAVAKVAFLQSLDVARAAARRLGEHLAAGGLLDDPGDVFYLTVAEIDRRDWEEARETVRFRRQRRQEYQRLELPVAWRGTPEPQPVASAASLEAGLVLHGVAASPGTVEGRIRLVTDPADATVEAGEILVARTTDPSWAAIMFLSSALVMDIGGLLSHAAVVARELGIPCVANTKVGTTTLCTGDLCRVDGTAGTVELLERAV